MKRVLITGANRGIGLEFVRQCIQRGDHVFAGARNPDQAVDLDRLAREVHPRLTIVPLDVADEESIRAAHSLVMDHVDGLDLLINNAGINAGSRDAGDRSRHTRVGSLSMEAMLKVLRVNAVAPVIVAQTFLPLLKSGNAPKIASISSGLGSIARAGGGYYSYGASKAALNMLMKSLAVDLSNDGIISVLFNPGWVKTDMGGASAPVAPEESVSGMLAVIDRLTMDETGHFLNWKDGSEIPW